MISVGEALTAFRAHSGFTADEASQPSWRCGVGPVTLAFPNFGWRRRAIECHDIHHILTGYACTLSGEVELAAWEFGAGPYPDIRATAFCLPLVAAGILTAPRKTFSAFARGRVGCTLYGAELSAVVLRQRLCLLEAEMAPARSTPVRIADALAFASIAMQAFTVVLTPFIAILAAALVI